MAGLALSGCAASTVDDGGPSAATQAALAAPAGAAFYTPPSPLPAGSPGDVIWSRPYTAIPGVTAYLVLYRSTTVAGKATAVSGVVAVPKGTATGSPRPVVAWAHGTTGLGDSCAPSRATGSGDAGLLLAAQQLTARGYVVTATDYQGLGTPGGHPYVVGLSEGRNVLDSIRAAERLAGTGATASSQALVWGHSQGGGAAMFTAELAPTYASDVRLVGAVAGAPAAELGVLSAALTRSPYFGYELEVAAGAMAAYPDLPYGRILTPAGLAAARKIGNLCGGDIIATFRGKNAADYIIGDPATIEPFEGLLEANTPGNVPTSVPIFVYQGSRDEQIPVVVSQLMMARMCKRGGFTATRTVYEGKDHVGALIAAIPDVERFLADRLAGKPAATDCAGGAAKPSRSVTPGPVATPTPLG